MDFADPPWSGETPPARTGNVGGAQLLQVELPFTSERHEERTGDAHVWRRLAWGRALFFEQVAAITGQQFLDRRGTGCCSPGSQNAQADEMAGQRLEASG